MDNEHHDNTSIHCNIPSVKRNIYTTPFNSRLNRVTHDNHSTSSGFPASELLISDEKNTDFNERSNSDLRDDSNQVITPPESMSSPKINETGTHADEILEGVHQLNMESPQNLIHPWFPRVSVIGPGGAQGFKVLGFLSPVEDSGLLNYVDTYCGVSVGAIISLLIICGYQIREIVGEAAKLDIFKEIEDFNFKSMIENQGLMSNEPARKRLTQLVIDKFGNVPTLYSLYMRTGKAFVTVTLNATDEECVIMDPFKTPDISCVDATMFSMNIPFLFYQLVYRGKVYVDGAIANPYPVDYFDDGKTNILGIYTKTVQNNSISGLLGNPNETNSEHDFTPSTCNIQRSIGSRTIIQKIEDTRPANDSQIMTCTRKIITYALKISHSLIDQRRNHIIQQASTHCKHVCLETKISDITGYSINVEDKGHMLVEGFNEGKAFLSQLQTNSYTGTKIVEKSRYSYPTYYMEGDPNIDSHIDPISVLSSMNM
jgi:predicted acylesterase/phospholipase RssA